jgi:hypothetical protein
MWGKQEVQERIPILLVDFICSLIPAAWPTRKVLGLGLGVDGQMVLQDIPILERGRQSFFEEANCRNEVDR